MKWDTTFCITSTLEWPSRSADVCRLLADPAHRGGRTRPLRRTLADSRDGRLVFAPTADVAGFPALVFWRTARQRLQPLGGTQGGCLWPDDYAPGHKRCRQVAAQAFQLLGEKSYSYPESVTVSWSSGATPIRQLRIESASSSSSPVVGDSEATHSSKRDIGHLSAASNRRSPNRQITTLLQPEFLPSPCDPPLHFL